jgi:hypothetical protein
MKLMLALAVVTLVGLQGPTVYEPGDGVSLPQVTRQVKAEYTSEAMQNRIEGKVGLDAVGVQAWCEGRQGGGRPRQGDDQFHVEVARFRMRAIVTDSDAARRAGATPG